MKTVAKYFTQDFYPENFILLGSRDFRSKLAEEIVKEASTFFPEKFGGETPCISFELRYVPPFEKKFTELKRLQWTAKEAAGRRDEFRGYIIIDMNSYLMHEKEPYLDITLRFLADMSGFWKYIFVVDNRNGKAAKELISHVLSVLLEDIPCEVKEDKEIVSSRNLADTICREQGVVCSESVQDFFHEVLNTEKISGNTLTAIVRDIAVHCGKQIGICTLNDYFAQRETFVKYLLSAKQYEKLTRMLSAEGRG